MLVHACACMRGERQAAIARLFGATLWHLAQEKPSESFALCLRDLHKDLLSLPEKTLPIWVLQAFLCNLCLPHFGHLALSVVLGPSFGRKGLPGDACA